MKCVVPSTPRPQCFRMDTASPAEVRCRKSGWSAGGLPGARLRRGVAAACSVLSNTDATVLPCEHGVTPVLRCRKSGWSAGGLPGARLRRGYTPPPPGEADATMDPRAEAADQAAAGTPIDRLVLVVHGIGQNLAGRRAAPALLTLTLRQWTRRPRAHPSTAWCWSCTASGRPGGQARGPRPAYPNPEAVDQAAAGTPIDRLVLVVHGIGSEPGRQARGPRHSKP